MADPTPGVAQGQAPAQAPAPQGANPTSTPTPTAEEIRAQVAADLRAEFAGQLKELTGHETAEAARSAKAKAEAERLAAEGKHKELADAATARAEAAEAKYREAAVRVALLGASAEAIDPGVVHDLLAARGQVGVDGEVTIGGKPVAEAVSELLKSKPYLAKPAGGAGSGGGAAAGGAAPAKSVTRSQWTQMTPALRTAHVQAGGVVVEG